jgi:hypothetical protein
MNRDLGILLPGEHQFSWAGTDLKGHPVSVGTYLYSVVADDKRLSRKMMLVK